MYAKSLSKSRFYCPIQKYGENRGGDEQYRRETEGEREVVVAEAAAASRRMKSQGRINGGSDTTSTNQTPNRKPPNTPPPPSSRIGGCLRASKLMRHGTRRVAPGRRGSEVAPTGRESGRSQPRHPSSSP
jgi:hypothetical protein